MINLMITLVVSLMASLTAAANHPYISPCPGEFPIIGCGPCRSDQTPTQEAFNQMKECGFNVASLTCPDEGWNDNVNGAWKVFYEDAFRFAENAGMSVIVNSAILAYDHTKAARNWRERLVVAFRDKPNLGGWQVKDEPIYNDFKESLSKGKMAYLEHAYNEVCNLDPNHMTFCNLLYLPDKHQKLGGLSYSKFITEYNSVFHTPVWSFDFYPVTTTHVRYNELFTCMDAFVKESKLTGRPFWSYVLCNQHNIGSTKYAKPTEGTMRFQAFVGMAYGAQGLVFWTYYLPNGKDSKYLTAPVKENGKRTKIWYAMQNVISEIKKWSYIFLGGEVEARHVSQNGEWTGSNLPLEKITYTGPGVLVSTIKNGNKRYMAVVSLDPYKNQELVLYRKSSSPDTEIDKPIQSNRSTDNVADHSGYKTERRTLKPGGYMFFAIP